MHLRVVLSVALGCLLVGCVTVSNSLSPEQVASFRVNEIRVGVAPGAQIWWGDGERAYARSKGQPETEADALAKTPEGQAYLRTAVSTKIKASLQNKLGAALRGSRPVRVEVNIKEVWVASAIQRVLVGGHHKMTGDINLVDPATGAVLSTFPAQSSVSMAGQGIGGVLLDQALLGEPMDRIVDDYTSQYKDWLVRS
jgi:hypothetical protein